MSISTTRIHATEALQPGQKAAQPDVASRALAGVLSERAVAAPAEAARLSAAKSADEAKAGEADKVSAEQTTRSLQEINKVMDALSVSVQFQVDPDYKESIIRVVDQQSGKVIRQFPTAEVVRIAKALDNLKGLLFAQAA